jgi:hypothetical protein
MRTIYWDLFLLSCIYLDVSLFLSLMGLALNPFVNVFSFISIPVGFFIVSGSALVGHGLAVRSKTQTPFRFKQSVVFGSKKKDELKAQKKGLRPLHTTRPKVEFGMHTCPAHGIEKCAGNYLDLHSCNSPTQSSKQLFWKEITLPAPAR